jgi:hypothetical protein
MKIQVVKKGTKNVKAFGACPYFVDAPPDGVDVRKPKSKE